MSEDGIEGIVASSLAGADNQSLTVVELGNIRLRLRSRQKRGSVDGFQRHQILVRRVIDANLRKSQSCGHSGMSLRLAR